MIKVLFVDGSNIHQGTRHSMRRYQSEMLKSLETKDFCTSIFMLRKYNIRLATYLINIINLFFKSQKYDFVITVDHSDALFSLLCNSQKRIIVVHDLIMLRTKWLSRKIYRSVIYRSIAACRKLLFVSQSTQARFSSIYNWEGNGFLLSPCVEIPEQHLTDLRLPPKTVRVLFIGNDNEYKNREHIFKLIEYANLKSLKLYFTLITPKFSNNKYVKFQSFSNVDIFSDVTDHKIKQAYIDSDILVVPSYDEGFGWHCIEAIASGCVVLSTNNGGLIETVKSDVYISGKDCSETAFLISHVVNNRDRYHKIQLENIIQYQTTSFQKKLRDFLYDQIK